MSRLSERVGNLFARQKRHPSVEGIEPPTNPTLNQQLVQNRSPFPWGLLSLEENAEVRRVQSGVLRVTSGGVCPNPWEIVSEERARELVTNANGILRVTAGGAASSLFN